MGVQAVVDLHSHKNLGSPGKGPRFLCIWLPENCSVCLGHVRSPLFTGLFQGLHPFGQDPR